MATARTSHWPTCHNSITEIGPPTVFFGFALERRRYIKTYYISRPSSYKFAELFNVSGEELVNLCKFISHILETMK